MSDYSNFRNALNEIVRILAPHSSPDAKRAMASKLMVAAKGEIIENLAFRHSDIGHIFFPDDKDAANKLSEQIGEARTIGEIASIIPTELGLLPTDLLTWPDCPPVTVTNPLSYWLPVIEVTPTSTTRTKQPDSSSENSDWRAAARDIALAYLNMHKEKDLHPSQNDVAEHVAKAMRQAKIYGPQGKPQSVGTIQREALRGEWWRKNR